MGKEIVGQKNSDNIEAKTTKIRKTKPNSKYSERSRQKFVQFFEFLKKLHGSKSNQKSLEATEEPLVKEIMSSVMLFFNQQTNYKQQDLERYVIYLANLLNILRQYNGQLTFSSQFKTKIRKFLACIVQARRQGQSKNSKIQALLFILATLIYKGRVQSNISTQNINNSIYSDKALVNHILCLTLSKYKRMSKFYGVVMIHLSNQQNSVRVKQKMIKSIFTNLSKIDHEPAFFNLLLYLRSEKNRVKINFHDIVDGQVFRILLQKYSSYFDQPQAYYIIDYLNNLLTLFPALISYIPQETFIDNVLISSLPDNIRHPLQQSTTIAFLQTILKYTIINNKDKILHNILQFILTIKNINVKLVNLIVDYDIQQSKMMLILENGLFECMLRLISPDCEENIAKQITEICERLINKFEKINRAICEYLRYRLKSHVKMVLEIRRRGNTGEQANHHRN